MKLGSKVAFSVLPILAATVMAPVASFAQPYNYSDVVPTPTECDAAKPGGAFAAWVIIPGSQNAQLELNTTLKGDSAAAFFTHLDTYANGQSKVLPANSFQFTASQYSNSGAAFPVVEWTVGNNPTVHVKGLNTTSVRNGHNGSVVYYDMQANGVPANARLRAIYLLTYATNTGSFFGYFNQFYINGNPVLNKNFTTYPCLGDIAVQVINFKP
ncbi:MAG TPA: hypothetical protein V6C72_09950 [Chroococcales cyanobacterium]